MAQAIVAHSQQVAQAPLRPRIVHDLRHGRRACDVRIGDMVMLEDGLHEVRADGRKGRTLRKVGASC